jgi:hypothetical protein
VCVLDLIRFGDIYKLGKQLRIMSKTIFTKTVEIASLVASASTTLYNAGLTSYLTENDLEQAQGSFNRATIINKSSTADITLKIIRVYIGTLATKYFDVPANNAVATLSDNNFSDLKITNLDGANATGVIVITIEKVIE